MRIGDKVLCKQTITSYYQQGEYYIITYISPDGNYIFIPYNNYGNFSYNTFHRTKNLKIMDSNYIVHKHDFIFKYYFISVSELRKQKINKIQNEKIQNK